MTSQGALKFFRHDYLSARALLRSVVTESGLNITTHEHPLSGPDGERISTDTVLIGNPDAENLIVLISGTHGVETLCGSACQSMYVAGGKWKSMPENTAVVLVHALNCWGAAHLRRNNEDNVDLARNFVNFDEPLPNNLKYEALREAVDCKELRGADRDRANQIHADYISRNSINQYVDALMGGQYQHANGFAYGGSVPTWSNRLLAEVLSPYASTARQVRIVDIHSGLGPYGYGATVTMQTGDNLERVRSIYGRWVDAPNEKGGNPGKQLHKVTGTPYDGARSVFPSATLCAVVIEFGTYPPFVSLQALLDDHWLTHYGDVNSSAGMKIKQQILEYHYPADPDWRQAVADRSEQVMEQTFRGLD